MKNIYLTALFMAGSVGIIGCQTATFSHTSIKTNVNLVDTSGIGQNIGTVTFTDSKDGLVIETHLKDLPPGPHGFHIHEKPSCGATTNPEGVLTAALQAGGHFDPKSAAQHGAPDGAGHLGDLPKLIVAENGTAKQKLVAPRLNTTLIKNRSVMIHAGSDNYSDHPQPLGGGGARIACGVIALN